ncbi:MAG: hypothetical protein HS113_07115 [Verrucomicrobiales bacterium]|nr:hypothetical protein [Verrucomicrobiales bacterium]
MKPRLSKTLCQPFRRFAWLLLLAAASAALARSQEPEVILPLEDGTPLGLGDALVLDPTSDPAHPAVLVGLRRDYPGPNLFRLTPDDTATEYLVETLHSPLDGVTRLTHQPGLGVYAIGSSPVSVKRNQTTSVWTALRSVIGGDHWMLEEIFFLGKDPTPSLATGMTVDGQGNVFVTGVATSGREQRWVIRRQRPGGVWEEVSNLKSRSLNVRPAIASFPGNPLSPTPAVIAVSEINSKWAVLRSQQQGAKGTWQVVDAWPGDVVNESMAADVVNDSASGRLYVCGSRGINGLNPSGWRVRMSADGGTTWQTLLDQTAGASWAYRLATDGAGGILVSGVVNPTGTTPLWTLVRNVPHQPWQNAPTGEDSWSLREVITDRNSRAGDVRVDLQGNVFLTGGVAGWSDPADTAFRVYLLRLAAASVIP